MFEHFRLWLKNPRIVETIWLILAVIVFVAVLKHFNLYEGFSKNDPIASRPSLHDPSNKESPIEKFSDKPSKITNM